MSLKTFVTQGDNPRQRTSPVQVCLTAETHWILRKTFLPFNVIVTSTQALGSTWKMQPPSKGPSVRVHIFAAFVCTLSLGASGRRHSTFAQHDTALRQSPRYGIPRVALAVQGRSVDVDKWITLYSEMRTNGSVSLFFLTYDEPITCPPGIFCYHSSNSTWAQGRNELARKILNNEEEELQRFKYWAFHDTDTIALDCWVCR